MRKIFLTLLIIFALTFPGMSVCATEQQTDPADAGDTEAEVGQKELDLFSDAGVYYYNPDYDREVPPEVIITEMYDFILSQDEQIQMMEDIIQAKDDQIAMMQKRVDRLGPIVAASVILIAGLIIYNIYVWRMAHDKNNSKIVDFRRRD